jgi:serine protease Do
MLEELAEVTARVADQVAGSVVRIGRDGGRGAGTVIAQDRVLTSAHNLRGQDVTVTFADGRSEVGRVKGVDPDEDLAVIEVATGGNVPIDWSAAAVPAGLGSALFVVAPTPRAAGRRATFGAVSALPVAFRGPRGRLIDDGFEHTAPVGRGSSGGPVVDSQGRMVGINTHRPGDGFYIARPVTAALKEKVDGLAHGQVPSRHRLGVALTPPHVARRLRASVGLPAREGVLIREVSEGSPAAAAGLQRGDLITAAQGGDVESIDALLRVLDRLGDEAVLALTVLRGSEELTVDVRFDLPSGDA